MIIPHIFQLPENLTLVAHFTIPAVQTWGTSHDQEFKAAVRQAAGITEAGKCSCDWYAFAIRCHVAGSRICYARQIPDVENIPKLILDAFTGLLYPDDNILYVRGVQVEGTVSPDEGNLTEVWIYGMSAESREASHVT